MEYLDSKHHVIDNTDKIKEEKPKEEAKKETKEKPKEEIKKGVGIKPAKEKVIKERSKKAKVTLVSLMNRISLTDKMLFVDNLSTMLRAGLALAPALKTLHKETKNRYMKAILLDLEDSVENGQLLSSGMKLYPKVFSEMIIATIEVGESTGMLADTLGNLADRLKSQKELRSKVFSALMYPIIVLIALIAVSLLLAFFVFPQMVSIFEDAEVDLPFTLVAVQFITKYSTLYYPYIIGGLVLLIFLLKVVFKMPKPKYLLHRMLLKLPIAGKIIADINLTRYAGNLHTLLSSVLAIVKGLEIVSRTLGNVPYRKAVVAMAGELEKGVSLDKAMEDRPHLFPSLAVQLCQVGTKTGELESILVKVSDYYNNRVNTTLTNLATIIEPVMLIAVGIAVAFIALSVISPMYELTLSFAEI